MAYLKKALMLFTLLAVLFVIVVFIILPKKNKNVEYKGTLVNGYIQIDRQSDKEEMNL
jgi:type IV secretory pathway component VirB8